MSVAPAASILALAVALALPARAAAQDAASDRIEQLERAVEALQQELRALRADQQQAAPSTAPAAETEALRRQVEALSEEVEERRLGGVFRAPDEGRFGLGPSVSKVYDVERGVSIGGYGEMLYQSFDSERDDGTRSSRRDEIDFLRAILYVGYKFNDRIVFNSEIEFEHANTGENGEVEVEFANVDFLLHEGANLRAGMMLIPMGFLNELHEPPTFFSARRPTVESAVIPTTWSENGVGVFGEPVEWFSYKAYLLAGLDATGFSASSAIRGGRQKGSNSLAEEWAGVVRFDFDPVPGLLFGVSGYHAGAGQDAKVAGEEIDADVTLWDAHVQYQWKGLQLRGLWTEGEIDDAAAVNALNGLTGNASVGERFGGWYGEIGWDVLAHLDTEQELVPFARWEELDTQMRVPAGFLRNPANDREILTVGFAYKPHPQVVIKLDWQDVDNAADTGVDQVNAAVGYNF